MSVSRVMYHLLRGRVATAATTARHHLFDQGSIESPTDDRIHHGQVFEVVVCLEKGVSGEEFHQNTANTPDVAGEAPAKVQYDLGRPVVAGRHDRGVVFVVESGRAKVD